MISPPFNFLLLDAASAGQRQDEALVLGAKHESFYKGDKEENRRASPYLLELRAGTPLAAWYFQHGWGQSWGVPVFASAPFEEVYRHFRKFLMVKTEDGERLYFRFYDPSVLRVFLPTCDEAQILEFFGGNMIKFFLLEDEDPSFALKFSHQNGRLQTEQMSLDSLGLPIGGSAITSQPLLPETVAALKASEKWEEVKRILGLDDTGKPIVEVGVQPGPQESASKSHLAQEEVEKESKPNQIQPKESGKKGGWKLFD